MRPASRLLASIRAGRLLEPGAPTGLTGLETHPSPRSTLLYLYGRTLDKLKQMPESSVYRQATENLTKQRLKAVQAQKPAGYDEWLSNVQHKLAGIVEAQGTTPFSHEGNHFVVTELWNNRHDKKDLDFQGKELGSEPRMVNWSEEHIAEETAERERVEQINKETPPEMEPEPLLTVSQIERIEEDIGAGLLEEVIQVAEGELMLANTMLENKSWEELTERAPEGQWSYFERK